MTFKHKLSRRLALLKDRAVLYVAASLAAAVISCERPLATDQGADIAALVVWPVVVPVAAVVVAPATANVTVDSTVQLVAIPIDSAGTALGGRAVTWTSGAPGVATVDGSGLVTGVAAGSATITATSEGKSGSAAVTV